MALPTSGPIYLSQIKAEFGGDGRLTSYYRGGGLVPNTPANAAVPTSGTIRVTNFYGASIASAFTPGFAGVSDVYAAGAGTATAMIQLRTDGTVFRVLNGTSEANGIWGSPTTTSVGNNYWAMATGGGPSGLQGDPQNAVLPLSSNRWWGYKAVSSIAPGDIVRSGRFTINVYSDAGGTALVASIAVYVEATAISLGPF